MTPDTLLTRVNTSEEDWVLLPAQETPAGDTRSPYHNAYLDFQLRTQLGTFSFMAQPTTSQVVESEYERTTHSQEQSPLFQLPVELRLNIYEHLLRIGVTGSGVELVQRLTPVRFPTRLAILSTCRRALAEAEDIFYSVNRLSLEHPDELWASLGPRRRCAVTSFTLPAKSAASTLHGLQQLRLFQNLESLHIERRLGVQYQDISTWAIMVPQLAAEVRAMERLVDVRIINPEATGLTEHDKVREMKLKEIDRKICSALQDRTG
ncbi:hypothetical protein K431DRAFT_295167 [Polychaeton citri CBS 116435]|uniref:Uncharacterized protein n=1 Tax=Polychaeton citri CBS 116435 TaxID=1314669 RepID=A0A9P4Q6M6_9PEZI|nr:hypothetical protein K431DRAFT_295167 [Polychaeton citri CBS 116435]